MTDYERIARAIEYLHQNYKNQPRLEKIAEVACVSPFHFQRMFTKWAGISPKQFNQYLTYNHAKQLIRTTDFSLAEIADAAGLSGNSRLHDLFVKIEAMTPGIYRQKGVNIEIKYSFHSSILGSLFIASTVAGICKISFFEDEDQVVAELQADWPEARVTHVPHLHTEIAGSLFSSNKYHPPVKLTIKGTPFQIKVWEALLKIPEGELVTYGQIARHIGHPNATRAVGSAIGKNPVAQLIPCHRVIRAGGNFEGYRWGSQRKLSLITREKIRSIKDDIPVSRAANT